jgi:multidrug efflux pump subunit AcrA (membrane-fusion protein)
MLDHRILDLTDCTEYRQTLEARPPAIVHGTAGILIALLVVALIWSSLTRADLVVRAPGRVRPVATTVRVIPAARGEVLSASTGGRVAEVHFREGDRIARSTVLIRLETGHLDNHIVKQRRTIQAGEAEVTRLGRLEELAARQFVVARLRAVAELEQARNELRRTRELRRAEVHVAELALEAAAVEEVSLRRLAERRVAAPADLLKAATETRRAREGLMKARIPVDEGRVVVLRRALEAVGWDYEIKQEELTLKREAKKAEVEAARIELVNLELERQQAVIRAPIDGIITAGDVKVGDILEPGKAVVELARHEGFIFEAAVPSDEIGHLREGMTARIKLDAYDYQRYGTVLGTVSFLSPDSAALREKEPVSYTVRIALSDRVVSRGNYRGRVKLGMAGQAEVITGHESLLILLAKRIRQTISLG